MLFDAISNYLSAQQSANQYPLNALASSLGWDFNIVLVLFAIIVIWSSLWKLFACWKAARNNSFIWFLALFFINTFGILEILYLFIFSKWDERRMKLKIVKTRLKNKRFISDGRTNKKPVGMKRS